MKGVVIVGRPNSVMPSSVSIGYWLSPSSSLHTITRPSAKLIRDTESETYSCTILRTC
ncbi:Uncharacterised protein [Mycobacterium tuberculosis]|nr:Uncharacterised protein [Mycobacterium tuberculosis]CKN75867.1 Uncharacterised protein [Mycobacterium tuberculosis]CKQ93944.1 Uncharacterised protein [Mycobacterium tuberculosis]CKR51783.1 Uncharacterised protein [Mycobacterium tuberculosis]CKT63630.1 Uncharacterised protein [Mycobacterium tuberculosis]